MSTTTQHFDSRLVSMAAALERVPYVSREQIGDYVRSSRPAILTGALVGWPALTRWCPKYFRDRWGNRTLYAHETTWGGRSPYEFSEVEGAAQRTLADFIDRAMQDADYSLYAHQIDAAEMLPGSLDDLDYSSLIDFLPAAPRFQPNIWIGTPGTRSGLHFDDAENLMAMFHGAKQFLLANPSSPRLLYPSRASPAKSQIDPVKVDWMRFPLLRRAEIYIDVLRPGEVLFLPRHWWHYFASLELTINSTCWFFWQGLDYQESRSLLRAYLQYLLRCGPSYPLRFLYEFLWYGTLRRPYERKALTPPPMGVHFWERLRGPRRSGTKQ